MNLERLKALLEAGTITQEEFDELAKNLEPAPNPEPAPEPAPEPIDLEKIDKLVQSKLDKALAQERKEKAEYKRKYENERKARLTDDELKKVELEEKISEIAEREKAIQDKENRLFAVKAIKEAGLDDGSDTALSLVDFVMANDETEIKGKVKAFKELFDKAVKAEVDKRFKEGGYTPRKSENLNGGKNPYMKEQWNLTEQMNIEISNPELAAQLKAAAGVK